jgi:hypothetical protein
MSSSSTIDLHAAEEQVVKFLLSVADSYDPAQHTLKDWCRAQSRRFYHEVNKEVGFLQVYDALMIYHTETANAKKAEPAPAPAPARLAADASLANVFAADGELTEAEERMGRAQLNKILFREHERWWSAFVCEAEDDEDDSATASDRFSYHCARIISRKTGLRDDLIAPLVAAWLIQKTDM